MFAGFYWPGPQWIGTFVDSSNQLDERGDPHIGSVANTTKSMLSEGFTLLNGEKIMCFSAMFVISKYMFMNRFALSVFL
jgi:hypothetical protein